MPNPFTANPILPIFPRSLQPELMDQPGLAPADHTQALAGLARINRLSFTPATLWPPLAALATRLHRSISVLDIACGGGDNLCALATRAARTGLTFNFHGCDISATALALARRRAASLPRPINFFQLDPFSTPPPTQFDAIICTLFLHHLTTTRAVQLLQFMHTQATHLGLVNDLERCRPGFALAAVIPHLLTRSPVVHTDALLSVRAAFTLGEATALASQAGLKNVQIHRTWPFRWQMIWNPSPPP